MKNILKNRLWLGGVFTPEEPTTPRPVPPTSAPRRPKWYLNDFDIDNLADARSFAIDHGWRSTPQKVQVRRVGNSYYIEPYEKDCSCPGLISPY